MAEGSAQPGRVKYKKRKRYEGMGHARAVNFTCFHNLPLLGTERTQRWMVEAVELARDKHAFHLWAYAIMPTHVHLLIFPTDIGMRMEHVLTTVKQSVAKRAIAWVKENAPGFVPRLTDKQPNGHSILRFWQRGGGYDRNLWSPPHIWEMIDYFHLNPVEAGLCQRASDWYWSSAGWYECRRAEPLTIDMEHVPHDPR